MRISLIASLAGSLILLGACSTTPESSGGAAVEERKATPTPPSADTRRVAPVDVTSKPAGSPFAVLKDPNNILSKRSVYFDFDKFDVKEEYCSLVEAHAKFLRDQPSAKMLIQGNADERGSREYNVGLGQRRSDTVKKMLTLLGAREEQIESVSLGEEKPMCGEHTEGCWAKNRRGDMLYSGEY